MLVLDWLKLNRLGWWTLSLLAISLVPPLLISCFGLFRKSLDTPPVAAPGHGAALGHRPAGAGRIGYTLLTMPGRGPAHPQRGTQRLPPAFAGPAQGADFGQRPRKRPRSAGRHFRALLRPARQRGLYPHPGRGSLEKQITDRQRIEKSVPRLIPARPAKIGFVDPPLPKPVLAFGNGYGGFSAGGREYIITLAAGQVTPRLGAASSPTRPFGTVVSEAGVAYTWSENSHEFRISP